jgi:hypothetical protein
MTYCVMMCSGSFEKTLFFFEKVVAAKSYVRYYSLLFADWKFSSSRIALGAVRESLSEALQEKRSLKNWDEFFDRESGGIGLKDMAAQRL